MKEINFDIIWSWKGHKQDDAFATLKSALPTLKSDFKELRLLFKLIGWLSSELSYDSSIPKHLKNKSNLQKHRVTLETSNYTKNP